MKYTVAWAGVLNENKILKTTMGGLTLWALFFSFSTIKLALKPPLIIDRACYSKAVLPVENEKHTTIETDSFIKEALQKRFDSDAKGEGAFLSDAEAKYRVQEQNDLTKKGVIEKILVNSIETNGNVAHVDGDRIFAMGKVRSATYFPLVLTLSSTERSAENPYGLILEKVEQEKTEGAPK